VKPIEIVKPNSPASNAITVETRRPDPEITPWPEAPSPEAYHGIAGEFVRTLDPHTEADPMALLVQFLIAFGNVVGRCPYYVVEADEHHVNAFAVLVGSTSKGRKGTSWGQVRRRFGAVDTTWTNERLVAGLSSGEGMIWAVRDPIHKHEPIKAKGGRVIDYQDVIADPGVDDKRLLVTETEFASTLQVARREGNTLSPLIRQAWDTGSLRTLTKNNPAKATDAHISIIGHITKPELLRHLDSTETANGFANRFLWICTRRSKSLPDGGRALDLDWSSFDRRLAEAVRFARDVRRIARDDEAGRIWHGIYDELSGARPGLLGAVIGRAEAQVLRLACIYALLDLMAIIMPEHLKAALAVWEYAEASARFIFGDALGDPTADGILSVLRQSEAGMTRTEIRDFFKRNKSGHEIARALATLQEQGLAEFRSEETDGRPAERWVAIRRRPVSPPVPGSPIEGEAP